MPLTQANDARLTDGSRVAVVGGAVAGSFFSIFFLEIAARLGVRIDLDIFEPKTFTRQGPTECNMCGGIISETLVQMLVTEGIDLPGDVIQRGIEAYVLHTDAGTIRIDTPREERRIAAVHRGAGPLRAPKSAWRSFDGYLLELAVSRGARVNVDAVKDVRFDQGRPVVVTADGSSGPYDLLVVATGVNTSALKIFSQLGIDYRPPSTTKTLIREYHLGAPLVADTFGDAMHLYLLNLPRLKFAAIIPKGECVTLCMMGADIDKSMLEGFLKAPAVARHLGSDGDRANEVCGCSPRMNVAAAPRPFADRVVFIGDAGITRLYKDGIGAAYRTAKAAATTALLHGVSRRDFAAHYLPTCRALRRDNHYGTLVFLVTSVIQKLRFAQRGVLRMVHSESRGKGRSAGMGGVLWDTFTGSAPYKDIFLRTIRPRFLLVLGWHLAAAVILPWRGPFDDPPRTPAIKKEQL